MHMYYMGSSYETKPYYMKGLKPFLINEIKLIYI